MCGLCGIVRFDVTPEPETLWRMTRTLEHRGPDDEGVAITGPAGLGHTRLSILDLSAAGHQPMASADGAVTLVYNGEIYNFRELRRELEAEGVRHAGGSDTEVLLRAYLAWGEVAFDRLHGMFALALWDARASALHLLRDRFGIKPLYYATLPSGIVFGSEIKAILASRLTPREMSWRAFHEYLYYGNSLGAGTFFDGIRKLQPGHHLVFTETGATVRAYWTPDAIVPIDDPPEVAARTVLAKLDAAVKSHLVSDVPVGVFLSGGIDSSAIATLAQRHHAGPLRTYSVGFDFDREPDELPTARRLAERLGTDHHELRLTGTDMPAVIERLVEAHDVPFHDLASIPLALLSDALKRDVTVVLQGDGGDEMFAGYPGYVFLPHVALWRRLSRVGLALSSPLPESRTRHRLRRVLGYMAQPDLSMQMALRRFHESLERLPTRVFTRDAAAKLRRHDPLAPYRDIARRFGHLDALQAMLYADCAILLPDRYLEKVDRATMACGVESRVPFLDNDLAAYAMALPSSLKVRHRQKKWVLRRALRGTVPDEILDAPKTGFGIPVSHWLRGPLNGYLRSTLRNTTVSAPHLFDATALDRCIDEHVSGRYDNGRLLYKLLNFGLWHQKYLDP